MIYFTVNETESHACPVCWEETKTRIYQRLVKGLKKDDDNVKIFALLTGTNYNELMASQAEDLDAAIYQATAFVGNQAQTFKQKHRARNFKVGGRVVMVPDKIEKLTTAQNFAMRDALAANQGVPIEALISKALAIYLEPMVSGIPGYNAERVAIIEEEILEMPIGDTWATGFFLLSRLIRSGRAGIRYYFRQMILRIKSTRAWQRRPKWRSWRRSSASARSTSTPSGMAYSRGSYSSNPSTRLSRSSSYGNDRENITSGSRPLSNG